MAEYQILFNELKKYNPELLDKNRVLGISKADIVDQETLAKIEKQLPADMPCVIFSSHTGQGVQALKDLLWQALQRVNA